MTRRATIERKTNETDIRLELDLDGTGKVQASTGVGFFDHMLDHLGKHSLCDLSVQAKGDLHVDDHHTVEDVAICLGEAIEQALGDKAGIRRYGFASVPMDDALAQVSVDLSGRAALAFNARFTADKIGAFDCQLVEEFLRRLAFTAGMNLHVNLPYGSNDHHIAEAIFKALAQALRSAKEIDPARKGSVPSTKGSL
ncbi:MAG: Imidazoleglycerol-phosphate dehydratase [Planctomycetes bacterium ADurb.Bin126]|nr:MAG: Imidazoleglycerol-phosphate dehydratase [Planctomycetes bacterium ADurb.Bin126]HOD81304.1 imidazoleglycerol-phosphate dehydratase HisB [Phycisphaerae bacterium]HQL74119.1 imidazoleglycerol-phosphate dehydratase HisB [Phycisphaerae bacterium]